jgi:imidazole glycerol phosphate synthase subunit HisF
VCTAKRGYDLEKHRRINDAGKLPVLICTGSFFVQNGNGFIIITRSELKKAYTRPEEESFEIR